MIETCKRYIDKFQMIKSGDLVIAGVSGGADSLCLFHVLNGLMDEKDFTLQVVHVEHGIRGAESKNDAVFVEELCRNKGISCRVYEVDVPAYGKTHRLGLEEAARALRYDAFTREVDTAIGRGVAPERIKVALAHHADDNAETILFQMIRGSALAGLCGMKEVRKTEKGFSYIRPLLWATRNQIEAYLQEMEQTFCIDFTNMDIDYSRNRLRRKVIPELELVNKEAVSHINQTAKRLERIQDYLSGQAVEAYAACVSEKNGEYEIKLPLLAQYHPALREEVVKMAVYDAAGQKKDIGAVHLEAVFSLEHMQSGKQVHLPYGMIARREFDKILIKKVSHPLKKEPENSKYQGQVYQISPELLEELKNTGKEARISVNGGEISIKIIKILGEMEKIPKKRYTKFLDYDMIKIGFTIRTRRPKDDICIDWAGHHKKLKDYFIQEKVPKELRDNLWLIAQESHILWITGMRIAENCKITAKTTYGLQIQYNGGTKDGLYQTT